MGQGGGGYRGGKIWDNYNNIINKIYLKKKMTEVKHRQAQGGDTINDDKVCWCSRCKCSGMWSLLPCAFLQELVPLMNQD